MLYVVIFLVIVALVLLFLRAGRQNTVVYRRKIASPDYGFSVSDHASAFGSPTSSDLYTDNWGSKAAHEPLTCGGGEFGDGADDSYKIGGSDQFGDDWNTFRTVGGDFSSDNFNNCGSGTNDSGSSDYCSDSSSDCFGSSID